MDAIFDRVVREFFPNTTIPFWKKWLFRTAFGNKVFSRLIYNERLVNKNGVEWVNAVVELLELKCESEHHQQQHTWAWGYGCYFKSSDGYRWT